ncbi:WD40/YVTN/BNR-like repeat-containing protein [Prosthecobacter sp.]|jgi:hypothetical protein|uniref:WD40/YVTN/BNR-like repeat-containing protein n=1 Tax=Prosthecobacter sp. TaxID=1965333 RepID=UPI0037CB9549
MSTKLYLGTRKGLIEAERRPAGWRITRNSFLGVQVPMLLPDARDGTLYAAVEHGHFGTKFHASHDAGASWEERACPAFPPKPEDTTDVVNFVSQQPIPWDLKKVWALEAGAVPGELWCGTLPGGLFHSLDGGASWHLVESLWNDPGRAKWMGGGADWPGIHTILVDPRNRHRLLIAVSCGGVWESTDNGSSWTNIGTGIRAEYVPPEQAYDPGIQDPHRIAWSRADPDTIWMQHHNGIFHTTDGGKNWSESLNANPSNFGFAVAMHPQDPQTAWFVPGIKDELRVACDGALCVMRTRDGGQTFEALRHGLPQEHAYHLVYRHCLDVTGDGRTLAFGSTTGSVWISENGGDSWERLSADLPPIYCVRFG